MLDALLINIVGGVASGIIILLLPRLFKKLKSHVAQDGKQLAVLKKV